MSLIIKYAMLTVFVTTVLWILIFGNPEAIAQGSDWRSKAEALNRMGNFSEAIAAYNKALEINPQFVNALDGKGWSLNELGNYTQAIVYLDKALEIDPNHLDALVFKAGALYNLGNYTGAKYYADKAFEIDPVSPALHRLPEALDKQVQ